MNIKATLGLALSLTALSIAAPACAADLVLYDALDFAGPVAKAFEAKTGLTVDVVEPGSTGETLGKIAAEGNHPQFDIVWLDGSAVMERMAADHVLQPVPAEAYGKIAWTDLGKSLIPQSHAFLPTGTSTTAIEVNTKKVKADKMPKSWADLQAFAGSVAAKDPNLSGPAYQWLAGLFQTNGVDAGKELLARTLTNKSLSGLSSGGKVNKAVLTGDASVGINQRQRHLLQDRRGRTGRRRLSERRLGLAAAGPRHQRRDAAHGCREEVHRLRHQRRWPGRDAGRRRHRLFLHPGHQGREAQARPRDQHRLHPSRRPGGLGARDRVEAMVQGQVRPVTALARQ
ncbi:ABC transporter substrate-binding protein [Mesorhizobium atlanticum]